MSVSALRAPRGHVVGWRRRPACRRHEHDAEALRLAASPSITPPPGPRCDWPARPLLPRCCARQERRRRAPTRREAPSRRKHSFMAVISFSSKFELKTQMMRVPPGVENWSCLRCAARRYPSAGAMNPSGTAAWPRVGRPPGRRSPSADHRGDRRGDRERLPATAPARASASRAARCDHDRAASRRVVGGQPRPSASASLREAASPVVSHDCPFPSAFAISRRPIDRCQRTVTGAHAEQPRDRGNRGAFELVEHQNRASPRRQRVERLAHHRARDQARLRVDPRLPAATCPLDARARPHRGLPPAIAADVDQHADEPGLFVATRRAGSSAATARRAGTSPARDRGRRRRFATAAAPA